VLLTRLGAGGGGGARPDPQAIINRHALPHLAPMLRLFAATSAPATGAVRAAPAAPSNRNLAIDL
jgi:hypothetical protein